MPSRFLPSRISACRFPHSGPEAGSSSRTPIRAWAARESMCATSGNGRRSPGRNADWSQSSGHQVSQPRILELACPLNLWKPCGTARFPFADMADGGESTSNNLQGPRIPAALIAPASRFRSSISNFQPGLRTGGKRKAPTFTARPFPLPGRPEYTRRPPRRGPGRNPREARFRPASPATGSAPSAGRR